MKSLITELFRRRTLNEAGLAALLGTLRVEDEAFLYEQARRVQHSVYGRNIYFRGLIEFTSFCKNDCYYCGLRRSNGNAQRYRLTEDQILACCSRGYALGFRTFVLQGGEDAYFDDEKLCRIISAIHRKYPDCAITLSVGERSRESYRTLRDAGAERYLLRQETSDPAHYRLLHPEPLTIENRKRCLWDLKELGYQVGCGIMIGAPGQTANHILQDLHFMQELQPDMIGIGPFIPHHDTPFCNKPSGTLTETLHLLAILRLMFPEALLPSTTALGTIDPLGREKGILAGANVIMPNLSPSDVRGKYLLYDGKPHVDEEINRNFFDLNQRINSIGYRVCVSRGDRYGFRA